MSFQVIVKCDRTNCNSALLMGLQGKDALNKSVRSHGWSVDSSGHECVTCVASNPARRCDRCPSDLSPKFGHDTASHRLAAVLAAAGVQAPADLVKLGAGEVLGLPGIGPAYWARIEPVWSKLVSTAVKNAKNRPVSTKKATPSKPPGRQEVVLDIPHDIGLWSIPYIANVIESALVGRSPVRIRAFFPEKDSEKMRLVASDILRSFGRHFAGYISQPVVKTKYVQTEGMSYFTVYLKSSGLTPVISVDASLRIREDDVPQAGVGIAVQANGSKDAVVTMGFDLTGVAPTSTHAEQMAIAMALFFARAKFPGVRVLINSDSMAAVLTAGHLPSVERLIAGLPEESHHVLAAAADTDHVVEWARRNTTIGLAAAHKAAYDACRGADDSRDRKAPVLADFVELCSLPQKELEAPEGVGSAVSSCPA